MVSFRRIGFCLLALSPLLALGLAMRAGLRINHTPSFPVGVYWAIPKTPAVNDLIFFRPVRSPAFELAKERGYIGSGGLQPYEMLLKRIVGSAGDVVCIDGKGVTVNGRQLPHTAPRACDLAGRPLPVCRLDDYRLQPGEILAISDYSPLSFDSRYFGPVSRSQIQSVVVPVWTW
ncbi:MAG TPA: conjugative transfer signal peptidase TraF [Chthoniobacterales bacterium]